jgi:hypothetical protein
MNMSKWGEYEDEADDFGDFGEVSTPMKWLLGLGVLGGALYWWMNKASAQDADAAGQTENLQLIVTWRGIKAPSDKKLQMIGRLFKGIMGNEKFTLSNGTVIDGCPGAPKNVSIIKRDGPKSIDLSGNPGRYVVYHVNATFGGDFNPETPYLRDEVADCIFKIVKAAEGDIKVAGVKGIRVAQ